MTQQQQQATLRTQITDVIKTMAQIPQAPPDLQQRLSDIQASVSTEQNRLSSKVNTTQVIDVFLELADTSQVKVTSLSTTPWSLINIGEYNYLILGVSLEFEGGLDNLVAFLREVESTSPGLVHVQHLSITGYDEQMPSSTPVVASLDVAIYAHPPVTD